MQEEHSESREDYLESIIMLKREKGAVRSIDIAEHFNYSPAALSASFKKETDTNLTTYVKQTRIREAIRLFNSTAQSVSDVALSVGYDDFAYFSRVFKEITGMSPRDYIKLNKAE